MRITIKIKNPEEYLADIKLYEGRKFEYEETGEVTLIEYFTAIAPVRN